MKNNSLHIRYAGLLGLAFFSAGTSARAAALVNIDTVLVGNAGNVDASAANTPMESPRPTATAEWTMTTASAPPR